MSTLDLRGDEIIMDAGCGTGRLTALLAERVPAGLVVGIDRSTNMVRAAADYLGHAAVPVVLADVSVLPFHTAFDVVFSTATFHWVLDHDQLFASVFTALREQGRLHAQCGGGANLERIHRRAHALMYTSEFAPLFGNWREPWEFATADETRQRLMRAGFVDVDTNIEEAPVAFDSAESFAAFASTVVLRPFLTRIDDPQLRASFVEQITAAAARDDPPFELDYWRLNIRARRPS